MGDYEIDIPSYFLCPISLEIMKDPVTVSTGITYDRAGIEKWIFSEKKKTCPMTKQALPDDEDLTPNITLRRVIQSWCTINASHGVERFPTPRPPVNKDQLVKLLNNSKSPQSQMNCLRRLRTIAAENETNKRCIESAGAVHFLASIIINNSRYSSYKEGEEGLESTSAEALSILYSLKLSDSGLQTLLGENDEFLESIERIMQNGSYESRAYAVLLLNSIFEVVQSTQAINLRPKFFTQIVQVLEDQISTRASKAVLQLLINICPMGRNKIKAVEAGAVPVLINLLLDNTERRPCELILTALDLLCHCAEGRAELMNHGAGLAVVSKKIFRISKTASERAVRILHSISKFSATPSVLQEMLVLGVVTKLCLVLQVDCDYKTKERAREILKSHSRAWKNSPCMPINLISVLPS